MRNSLFRIFDSMIGGALNIHSRNSLSEDCLQVLFGNIHVRQVRQESVRRVHCSLSMYQQILAHFYKNNRAPTQIVSSLQRGNMWRAPDTQRPLPWGLLEPRWHRVVFRAWIPVGNMHV
jgi:hypothetical protein